MTASPEFTPAGARSGIALMQHDCARFRVAYVSEAPSAPGDPFMIPGCGCRPLREKENDSGE